MRPHVTGRLQMSEDGRLPETGSSSARSKKRIGLLERFGFDPFGPAARDAANALLGRSGLPPVGWGVSSLRILKPWISLPTWLRRRRSDGRVKLYGPLFEACTPIVEGAVRREARLDLPFRESDFRGVAF